MLDFIIFLLATFGLTMIVTNSFLFKWVRNWADTKNIYISKLFKCNQCFGFWAAIIVYILMIYGVYFILYGFIGSIFCYLIFLLIKPFIDKYD